MGLSGFPGQGAAFLRGTRSVCRSLVSSRWAAVLARVGLGLAGLIVLAMIGTSALAGASSSSAAIVAGDAGIEGTPTPSVQAASAAPPASEAASQAGGDPPHPRRATPDDPVILNQATFEDFRRLPGIGPKRAEALLALRKRLGRFRQIEDLLRAKGIGRATLRKLRPLVRLDAPLDGSLQPPSDLAKNAPSR